MKRHNFTLVEILGVTVLLVILMVIGVGVYSYAVDSSKEKATRATITRLGNALGVLQDKGMMKMTMVSSGNMEYLTITVDIANEKLVLKKSPDPIEIDSRGYKLFMQAMDADSINSILDADGRIVDGWGQPLHIRFPGKFNKGSFDIISAGSDGKFGTNEKSWDENDGKPPVQMVPGGGKAGYRDPDGDLICDDIANFF